MSLTKRAIVIPDQHFPIEDKDAISVVLQAIRIVKPDLFINLGDVGEWESVSAWKYKKIKQPPLEYQLPEVDKDIDLYKKGEISKITKTKYNLPDYGLPKVDTTKMKR